MAITKIHALKATMYAALAYIENPAKTDGQLLVSGYNTDPQLASVDFEMTQMLARKVNYSRGRSQNLGYHLIQSFSPDDPVTPEQAHELGKKLAAEFTDGKFEYVVATHIDKGHIHNHIIINSVSFYDYKRLRTVPYKTAAQLRSISDRLCADAGLSVIDDPKALGQSYTEYLEKAKKAPPWNREIRQRLKFVLQRATSYEEFKTLAQELGVTVNDAGKHITYKMEGMERARRGNKLDREGVYLPDQIKERLNANRADHEEIRAALRAVVPQAKSIDDVIALLAERHIKLTISKSTGLASYALLEQDGGAENDNSEAVSNAIRMNSNRVPEEALGTEWSLETLRDAIETQDYSFTSRPQTVLTLKEQFEERQKSTIRQPDRLVQILPGQIERMSRDGIVLKVKNPSGRPARLLIDRQHVNANDDGTVSIALGSLFDYYFIAEDAATSQEKVPAGFIRGRDLIQQLEMENGVAPVRIQLTAAQVKSVTLRGVTLTMPQAGIERAFIPAKHVHYNKLSGACTVDVYQNWDYSYVAQTTQNRLGKDVELRRSLSGAELTKLLSQGDGGVQVSDENALRRKIQSVARKNDLERTQLLAKTLRQMAAQGHTVARDFTADIYAAQERISIMQSKISAMKEKNKQYGIAARCLQTCRTLMPVWQKYEATIKLFRTKYYNEHKAELDAFSQAAAALERMGVHQTVDPEKVGNLISDRETSIRALEQKIAAERAEVQELLRMQAEVESIQRDDNETSQRPRTAGQHL